MCSAFYLALKLIQKTKKLYPPQYTYNKTQRMLGFVICSP